MSEPPSQSPARVDLDLAGVPLTGDGIDGFFWPLRREELLSLRDAFAPALVAAVKAARKEKQRGADAAMLLSHHIVMEVMALFQAQTLIERLSGKQVIWPPNSRLWAALAEGREPTEAPLLARLRRGPPRRSAILNLAAPLARRFVAGRQAKGIRFLSRCPREGIVSTRFLDPLIQRHAALQRDKVSHVHLSYWFRGVEAADVKKLSDGTDGMADLIVNAAERAFATLGSGLNPVSARYLRNYVNQSLALVGHQLSALRAGGRRLPQALWTGSAGNIWDRMLRQATREASGSVTGHDHATGSGHFQNPWNYFLEFVASDCFVTDHAAKAEAAGSQADPALLFEEGLPELKVISSEAKVQSSLRSPKRPRRIMYVSTLYAGEAAHLLPLPADVTVLDWQARLLARLSDWGYEVIHKPHPQGAMVSPPSLGQFGSYERSSEAFEKIWDSADLLLFDYPSSTTFGFALSTDKPIVLVDSGQFEWLAAAAHDLQARCAMVDAGFDQRNRLTVDWESLKRAIAKAPSLAASTAFRDNFLGS